MKTLIIYDSQFGNTGQLAEAVAETLAIAGESKAIRVSNLDSSELQGLDLLVLASPTQGWRATPPMIELPKNFLAHMPPDLAVAVFDTRFEKATWITGSAARRLGKMLQRMGFSLLLPPESFFVTETKGPLKEGELERARDWARMLLEKCEAKRFIRA